MKNGIKGKEKKIFLPIFCLACILCFCSGCRPTLTEISEEPIRTPEQWRQWKQTHKPNEPIRHLVCGGSGVSRLLVYLDGTERLVAVEAADHSPNSWTAPYRIAHPELQKLPIWSNDHGRDQVEKLLSLENSPEVILRLDMPGMGIPPEELQRRTGIPVALFSYGDLLTQREALFGSLRFLGEILEKQDRAEEIILFFEQEIAELRRRTADVSPASRPSAYVGGISYRGAHGLNSTSLHFPPLRWLHAENVADRISPDQRNEKSVHAIVPREQLTAWSPEVLFIDMATLALTSNSAVEELRTIPLYRSLKAVENGKVYLLLPNSSYNVNFCSQLANAWFMGTVLYPDRFGDIDPRKKAEEIFLFLTGDSVLDRIDAPMSDRIFRQIKLNQ